jgi:predicted ester cyclase
MRVLTDIYTTFPDWTSHPVEIRAVKDTLVHRSIVTGTHKGMGTLPVNGGLLVGVPPTGKSFSTMHIHTLTFEDGYIKDHWATRDDIKMMQDLGLLPQSPTFG